MPSSKKRRRYFTVELHGRTFRLVRNRRESGRRFREITRTPFGPEKREQAERLADIMSDLLAAGVDPHMKLAGLFAGSVPPGPETREEEAPPAATTLAMFYERWVATKIYPSVRRAQARDYRRHLEGYVLPRIGTMPLAELTPQRLIELRAELLAGGGKEEGQLAQKTVRNLLGASLRALVRDALAAGEMRADPYASPLWRRWPEDARVDDAPEADPFSPDERDRIVEWFRTKNWRSHGQPRPHRPFWAYVVFLFFTGARPSEASGLRWRDVMLERSRVMIRRSRHYWTDAKTKTKRSQRMVELEPAVIAALTEIQPLRIEPDDFVFTNTDGGAIEPKAFSDRWYAALRALGIRVRGLYCAKDTRVSLLLMEDRNVHWIEGQVGVRIETLKRHYWKWIESHPAPERRSREATSESRVPPAVPPKAFMGEGGE